MNMNICKFIEQRLEATINFSNFTDMRDKLIAESIMEAYDVPADLAMLAVHGYNAMRRDAFNEQLKQPPMNIVVLLKTC